MTAAVARDQIRSLGGLRRDAVTPTIDCAALLAFMTDPQVEWSGKLLVLPVAHHGITF